MKYFLILTDPDALLCEKKVLSHPHSSNNKLPDQLAVSITVCAKPELRVIEGIIVALRWFEVAR